MYMKPSNNKTSEEANKIANSIKKPNQTKQQTKLITQGIQKGIEQYKKQHKAKLREQDKFKKKTANANSVEIETKYIIKQSKLAWVLLFVSLVSITGYVFLGSPISL